MLANSEPSRGEYFVAKLTATGFLSDLKPLEAEVRTEVPFESLLLFYFAS